MAHVERLMFPLSIVPLSLVTPPPPFRLVPLCPPPSPCIMYAAFKRGRYEPMSSCQAVGRLAQMTLKLFPATTTATTAATTESATRAATTAMRGSTIATGHATLWGK